MGNKNEKRAMERLVIPEAKVFFRKPVKFPFIDRFSRPQILCNIAKGGLCFESEQKIGAGEFVSFEIVIPGIDKFKVTAKVKWQHNGLENNVYLIGAQFLPFGSSRSLNSMKSLEALRRIDNIFSR